MAGRGIEFYPVSDVNRSSADPDPTRFLGTQGPVRGNAAIYRSQGRSRPCPMSHEVRHKPALDLDKRCINRAIPPVRSIKGSFNALNCAKRG